MTHRLKGHSSSPFYDHEFVANNQWVRGPRKNKYKKRKKTQAMPVVQRTVARWTCDRCGFTAEFPDSEGCTALEVGWLALDLTRSLAQGLPYRFGKNEQILCPVCVGELDAWFRSYDADDDNSDEELRLARGEP
jgi:hypothetical protein